MRPGAAYVGALAILTFCAGIGRAGGIGWPEAVARLTEERSHAEICVASLKGHGNPDQVARGKQDYGTAKAPFDGVISGLIAALSEGGNPERLPSLEAKLERGAVGLAAFCKTADDLLPAATGQKSWLGDAVKEAINPLINSLNEAVSSIYTNYRGDKAATRMTIRTQLEAAKWPEFDGVKAVQ
jgi:hypothetical protein